MLSKKFRRRFFIQCCGRKSCSDVATRKYAIRRTNSSEIATLSMKRNSRSQPVGVSTTTTTRTDQVTEEESSSNHNKDEPETSQNLPHSPTEDPVEPSLKTNSNAETDIATTPDKSQITSSSIQDNPTTRINVVTNEIYTMSTTSLPNSISSSASMTSKGLNLESTSSKNLVTTTTSNHILNRNASTSQMQTLTSISSTISTKTISQAQSLTSTSSLSSTISTNTNVVSTTTLTPISTTTSARFIKPTIGTTIKAQVG
jgi:hypothetical protein